MTYADRMKAALEPVMTPSLSAVCDAWAAMIQPVDSLVMDVGIDGDPDYVPGWGTIFDIDTCPVEQLPYLAQFVGETLPAGATEAQWRQRLRDQPNKNRGTPAGIKAAARLTLSNDDGSIGNPDATVVFIERSASACPSLPAYGLTVGVRADQCPNPAATEAAIRSNMPAGIVLEYIVSDDPVIDEATRTIDALTGPIDFLTIADVT